MQRQSLTSLVENFRKFAGDAAVVERQGYRRKSLTYAELAAQAESWKAVLADREISAGDRVVLWGANSAKWVAAFWGVLLRGAVAVPMDGTATREFVERTIRESGAKLVLRDRSLWEPGSAGTSLALDDHAAGLGRPAVGSPGSRQSSRSAIAEILFTSGTTAEPRGVVLTHGNFLANLEPVERAIEPYLHYERWLHPLKFVSLVPLSHVFGQFIGLLVPPLFGATLVLENSANPADILRTVKRERATVLIAVPRMLELVRAQIEREVEARGWRKWFARNYGAASGQSFLARAWRFRRIHRLFGIRFWAFICGGAALPAETELFFKRLGFAVVQGYGMTETASLISLNHPFSATEGSVGKILPGREFRLAEDGEILVRGENVSSGYWEKGGLRGQSETGWLRTGDLGELDADGSLRFRGRKKNLIVTAAGLNVYPEDLEKALKKHPAVGDAVVVPIESKGNSEAWAFLLPNQGASEAQLEAAVQAANASLSAYQQVRRWSLWPEPDFPRTATGKPRLAAIAARAVPTAAAPGAGRSVGDGSDAISQLLPASGFDALSSLDRVELLSALEQRYNIEIDEEEFSRAKSAAELRDLVARREPRRAADVSDLTARYHYPRWTQREPARLVRLFVHYLLVWPATRILAHPRVVGRELLGGTEGPVIVVSNHITRRADIGLILAALPPRFRHRLATAMGGETLLRMRRPPKEWFFARRWTYQLGYWLVILLFNIFPLPQFSGFRQSFRFAGESVDRGYSLLIFPEGEVNNSEDGRMASFQSGIGLLAENLRIPVVPMRLDGLWQMKRERRRLAHAGELTVHIGTPVRFPAGTPAGQIARELEAMVRRL